MNKKRTIKFDDAYKKSNHCSNLISDGGVSLNSDLLK